MTKNPPESVPREFEPEFVAGLKTIFEEKIASLEITVQSTDGACVRRWAIKRQASHDEPACGQVLPIVGLDVHQRPEGTERSVS